MLKISFAGCLGLSPAISVQFTFKMCATAENHKKHKKTSLLWGCKVIQAHQCWYP